MENRDPGLVLDCGAGGGLGALMAQQPLHEHNRNWAGADSRWRDRKLVGSSAERAGGGLSALLCRPVPMARLQRGGQRDCGGRGTAGHRESVYQVSGSGEVTI